MATFKKGYVVVKDENNECFIVDKHDSRYINGELKHNWVGLKHKPSYFKKVKKTYKRTKHQQGLNNSHYNTVWVTNKATKEDVCIKTEELESYLQQGYVKGRSIIPSNDKKSNFNEQLIRHLRYDLGYQWKDICEYLGCCKQTLAKFRKEHNIS